MPMISMITGIISVLVSCLGGLLGPVGMLALPLAVVGLVCGFIARSQQKKLPEPDPRAMQQATAGIVTSAITLAMIVVVLIALAGLFWFLDHGVFPPV